MGGMVIGAIRLLVFMAFAHMEMQALGAVSFDPFLSTADIARLLPDAGMVCLNVVILITSLCPGIGLVG